MKFLAYFCLPLLAFLLSACSNEPDLSGRTAPLFDSLGTYHYEITANSDLAQRYFDQGLILSYGFNHAEAFRSFNEAVLIDSNCAMGYWGMALVLGPNINAAMANSDVKTAYEAIQKAKKHLNSVTEKEQDMILALEKRYSEKPVENRQPFDSAYADAMREVHKKYPNDNDIAALFAESLMDLHPWDYWFKNGKPRAWTNEIVTVLEGVLKRDENHPGANHLYIHTVEASKHPEKGLKSAERLARLVPGAGHLVHMPAHIYIRIGKYNLASSANQMAIKADKSYLAQCHAQSFYPFGYYPHNYHFLCATASMEGRSRLAIEAANKTSEIPPDSLLAVCGYQALQHFYVMPYYVYVRFAKWDKILSLPEPEEDYPYPRGIHHFARGMAFASKNKIDSAKIELEKLKKFVNNDEVNSLLIWGINSAGDLLQIADYVLEGEIAAQMNNYSEAITLLKKGIEIEDSLKYDEPPTWFYSVRHVLGAVLIENGQFQEAEKVYRKDLEIFPENGWALYGLLQSLKHQNKLEEAEKVKVRFDKAWQNADVRLTSSISMVPLQNVFPEDEKELAIKLGY